MIKPYVFEWEVIDVKPLDNYILELWFIDGSHKLYDMRPNLDKPAFQQLKDLSIFDNCYVDRPTVAWSDLIDIAPEELYYNGKDI